jgi:hypothetical protein
MACVILFVVFGRLALPPALGDGCFVFRWNKGIDINEPTQKAIIVYDAGREDLLLQVKYEGPLEEFGWLIPVPGLPTVEKGSMQPFYELSQLTQRQWGPSKGAITLGGDTEGAQDEAVKVIEIKTVGAYEVSILSAEDAGSLERWLKDHDYSIPAGKTGIIDDYIHRGWYFVASKIDLRKPVGLQKASGTAPRTTSLPPQARKTIRKQLASGELHPLLISFDSPRCIYPLRISAVSGKPSEISLYILSGNALLNAYIFHKDLERLQPQEKERKRVLKEQQAQDRAWLEERQRKRVATMINSLARSGDKNGGRAQEISTAEVESLAKESWRDTPQIDLDTRFFPRPYELVQPINVTAQQIPACVKDLLRLKGKSWALAKQVCTFRSGEMHDLEFQPATSVIVATLPEPAGNIAANVLVSWDPNAAATLIAASQSANTLERINASSALRMVRDRRITQSLPTLFKDERPEVRFSAAVAADPNWDPQLIKPLTALFRDPYSLVRKQATRCLCLTEPPSHAPAYLTLLHDRNPDVQVCALNVLSQISPSPIPRADLVRLLWSPRLDVVYSALDLLQQAQTLDFMARRRIMEPLVPTRRDAKLLSSAEAAPLTTNQLAIARLAGLEFLRQNADAQAVALTLPLLRDTNSIVRNRAFALLRTVSGQNIPQNDPAKWEQWWAANKATFVVRKPAQ